jgi:alpha-tubulin suppressor-like RCC1 family protein
VLGQGIYYATNSGTCTLLGATWGTNCVEYLSNPAQLAPISFGPGRTVIDVAMGNLFVCAILDDYSVRCWGNIGAWLGYSPLPSARSYNQGVGNYPSDMGTNLPAVNVGGNATQISCGNDHACVLLTNDQVFCWGGPYDYGYINTASIRAIDTAIHITAGWQVTCVVMAAGTVSCFGSNAGGQVTTAGSTTDYNVQSQIALGNTKVIKVYSHPTANLICALSTKGRLYCWGAYFGQRSGPIYVPYGSNCTI